MAKPVISLDDLDFATFEDGPFMQKFGVISNKIGARKLGYNLTVVPPGKKAGPFHSHRINEEMFFILDGEGLLRFGDKDYKIRKNDIIACPPGGPDVAHQILNTGNSELRYLALSTNSTTDVCEYPDSEKVAALAPGLRHISRKRDSVPYSDGEA